MELALRGGLDAPSGLLALTRLVAGGLRCVGAGLLLGGLSRGRDDLLGGRGEAAVQLVDLPPAEADQDRQQEVRQKDGRDQRPGDLQSGRHGRYRPLDGDRGGLLGQTDVRHGDVDHLHFPSPRGGVVMVMVMVMVRLGDPTDHATSRLGVGVRVGRSGGAVGAGIGLLSGHVVPPLASWLFVHRPM